MLLLPLRFAMFYKLLIFQLAFTSLNYVLLYHISSKKSSQVGPTGYTPCEPRGHFVSDIAMRCAHGAICARSLECEHSDSASLDYVASGSGGRAGPSSRLTARQQKEATARAASFCWWSMFNENRTFTVLYNANSPNPFMCLPLLCHLHL
jgi:hypothetical protein